MNHAREIARLRQSIAMRPLRVPTRGGGAGVTLYQVVWGQLLPALARQGIVFPAGLVTGSSLPDPGGGADGQITVVPAYPFPTGLPDGVGVALVFGSSQYVFVVHDGTNGIKPDAVAGDFFVSAGTVNLDKVVGAKTYRYVCQRTPPGWW